MSTRPNIAVWLYQQDSCAPTAFYDLETFRASLELSYKDTEHPVTIVRKGEEWQIHARGKIVDTIAVEYVVIFSEPVQLDILDMTTDACEEAGAKATMAEELKARLAGGK